MVSDWPICWVVINLLIRITSTAFTFIFPLTFFINHQEEISCSNCSYLLCLVSQKWICEISFILSGNSENKFDLQKITYEISWNQTIQSWLYFYKTEIYSDSRNKTKLVIISYQSRKTCFQQVWSVKKCHMADSTWLQFWIAPDTCHNMMIELSNWKLWGVPSN